jgi:hypothetical protein
VIWRLRLLLTGKRRRILIGLGGLVVLLAVAGGVGFALNQDDDGGESSETATKTQARLVTF